MMFVRHVLTTPTARCQCPRQGRHRRVLMTEPTPVLFYRVVRFAVSFKLTSRCSLHGVFGLRSLEEKRVILVTLYSIFAGRYFM